MSRVTAQSVQPSIFGCDSCSFQGIYSISPACLDYFSLDEFTPLCLKIYAFSDTGTPTCYPTRWESKQPKFLAPPQLPTFANFPLPFRPGDESTTKKRYEKDLSESKMRDCSMIECISLSKKSTRASRGWEVLKGSMAKKKTDAATSS